MRVFAKAAATCAGVALTATPAPAGVPARTVAVPCSATALNSVVAASGTGRMTIRLARSCTYDLLTALPVITGDVVLTGGPSTAVKRDAAAPDFRVLDVAAGGTLRVRGVSILNGSTSDGDGGGIRNAGSLVLDSVTVSGDTALGENGGGLANTGRALVSRTVFTADATRGPAGGRDGGAIYNDGTLTVFESRLTGDIAVRDGGGIFTTPGHSTRVVRGTVSGNTAAGRGGGIFNAGTTALDRSLVELNLAISSATSGGGIFDLSPGAVTLRRSLVHRNSPDNCDPAGAVPGCAS